MRGRTGLGAIIRGMRGGPSPSRPCWCQSTVTPGSPRPNRSAATDAFPIPAGDGTPAGRITVTGWPGVPRSTTGSLAPPQSGRRPGGPVRLNFVPSCRGVARIVTRPVWPPVTFDPGAPCARSRPDKTRLAGSVLTSRHALGRPGQPRSVGRRAFGGNPDEPGPLTKARCSRSDPLERRWAPGPLRGELRNVPEAPPHEPVAPFRVRPALRAAASLAMPSAVANKIVCIRPAG